MRVSFFTLFIVTLFSVGNVFSQPQIPPPPGGPSTAPAAPGPEANVPPPVIADDRPRSGMGYKSEILEGFYEEFVYNAVDRRDPFSPFQPKINFSPVPITHPLQRFQLEQLTIIGIIWNNTSPKALVLDPAGTSYVILENDRIGNSNGYVAKIREGEVVVVEEHMDVAGNKAYLTKLLPFRKN